MLQAEYAALKEQKSMQGKELVKIEDSVEKGRRLKRDQGMELSNVEHAQAEHAEAMTKANSQMEAVRAMVQDVEMLKAENKRMAEQIEQGKQQSAALKQQLEEVTNARKAAAEYAEAAKEEIDTWTERAKEMEDELASARRQIAELAELDREFPTLQKRLGEETSIRSKALADTEWMRSASVRKADEAKTMMEKLETHSNAVIEELATKEEKIAELSNKMKDLENRTGEDKHNARMKVIDLEKEVAKRDDDIKVKKEDAEAVRLKVDNKIKEYDDTMKSIVKQIQRLTGKNLGSDKSDDPVTSPYALPSHFVAASSSGSSMGIPPSLSGGPRGMVASGRPGMGPFPGSAPGGPPPYHAQPTPILNRAASSGGYSSSGYSSSGYR